MSNSIVITLFENDYVLGVGALVNSLWKNGFRGIVYAGYRGELSRWAASAERKEQYAELPLPEGVAIRFVPVAQGWHLANLKPRFMMDVWDVHELEADSLFYFDPDIVIKCQWKFFEEWVQLGVAMCQEIVMIHSGPDHPIWRGWEKWAIQKGWSTVRSGGCPLNTGFVGASKAQRDVLELWHALISSCEKEVSLDRFAPVARPHLFAFPDQDTFNVLSLVYTGSISRIGPEGMDFVGGGFTMSHAAGGVKPWRKRFVRSAFSGVPPTLTDKGWAANLEGPIQVLPPPRVRAIRRSIRVASAIGRFIRRS